MIWHMRQLDHSSELYMYIVRNLCLASTPRKPFLRLSLRKLPFVMRYIHLLIQLGWLRKKFVPS